MNSLHLQIFKKKKQFSLSIMTTELMQSRACLCACSVKMVLLQYYSVFYEKSAFNIACRTSYSPPPLEIECLFLLLTLISIKVFSTKM